MGNFNDLIGRIKQILNYTLADFDGTRITLWRLIAFVFLLFALFYIARKLRKWLVNHVLIRSKLDLGAREAIGTITRYIVLFFGFLMIFQTVGINLTTFNVLAGAVGIGIGFGLQTVASNFISGLIILFERPI
jgi:small-conductance mechanosensitive channel